MARAVGMSPREFRDKDRRSFFTDDIEEISKMVEFINNYVLNFPNLN